MFPVYRGYRLILLGFRRDLGSVLVVLHDELSIVRELWLGVFRGFFVELGVCFVASVPGYFVVI